MKVRSEVKLVLEAGTPWFYAEISDQNQVLYTTPTYATIGEVHEAVESFLIEEQISHCNHEFVIAEVRWKAQVEQLLDLLELRAKYEKDPELKSRLLYCIDTVTRLINLT